MAPLRVPVCGFLEGFLKGLRLHPAGPSAQSGDRGSSAVSGGFSGLFWVLLEFVQRVPLEGPLKAFADSRQTSKLSLRLLAHHHKPQHPKTPNPNTCNIFIQGPMHTHHPQSVRSAGGGKIYTPQNNEASDPKAGLNKT